MSTTAKAAAKPPKEKEEEFSSACVALWPLGDTSLQIVRGFSDLTTSHLKHYPEYRRVKDIAVDGAVLVAITASVYQGAAEDALRAMEYKEVLQFRGNGDSSLKFWIKDRTGDQCAEVGPPVPDIKLSYRTDLVWDESMLRRFPSCCGAYILELKSRMGGEKLKREKNLNGAASSCSNLELSCVRCADPTLGDLIFAGHFPIYKYSTSEGELRYILARPPNIGTGAQLLIAGKSVDLHAAIESFRKKAYKKD